MIRRPALSSLRFAFALAFLIVLTLGSLSLAANTARYVMPSHYGPRTIPAMYSYAHDAHGMKLEGSDAGNVVKTSGGRIMFVGLAATPFRGGVLDQIVVIDLTNERNIFAVVFKLDTYKRTTLAYRNNPKFKYQVMNTKSRGQVVAVWADPKLLDKTLENSFSLAIDDLYRWRIEKARSGLRVEIGGQPFRVFYGATKLGAVGPVFFDENRLYSPNKRVRPKYAIVSVESIAGQSVDQKGRIPIGGSGSFYVWNADTFRFSIEDGESVSSDRSLEFAANVFKRAKPGVVLLAHTDGESSKSGAGFIVNTAGDIITNRHVVDGAPGDIVTVRFSNGKTTVGKIAARHNNLDLALVRPVTTPDDLTVLEFSNTELRVGESVLAIGHPKGYRWSLTKGTVSAIRDKNDPSAPGLIQTDAAVNPGNSGGPLLNASGEVVGVITLKAKAEGIGLAIPANLARDFHLENK